MADRDEKRRTNEKLKTNKKAKRSEGTRKGKTIYTGSAERKRSYWELKKN